MSRLLPLMWSTFGALALAATSDHRIWFPALCVAVGATVIEAAQ